MKRLLFVFLMMICSVSWAEWQLCAGGGAGGEMILDYCDKSTIRKNGAISRMWELTDYSSVQVGAAGERHMSAKSLRAYNCRDETFAIISFVLYSGSMGEGTVVWSGTRKEREWEWEPIVPGSIAEAKWKVVCGKK